jgi:capsular exopolysaccharide synthesis family protein
MENTRASKPLSLSAPPPQESLTASGHLESDSLHYFGDAIWTHRRLFASCLILCIGIATVFSFLRKPAYQARGSLELQIPSAVAYARDSQVAGVDGQSFDSYLDVQIGILGSDTLIRRVIARLGLAERTDYHHSRWLKLSSRSPSSEDVFETVKNDLIVRHSRLNKLIEVLFRADDPHLAADFVNTLINEYQQQNLESRWQMVQSTDKWLSHHLIEIRAQLETSQNELQSYARANDLLMVSDKDSLARERLHIVQESLSKAQSERILRQSQMEMAAGSPPDAVPEVLGDQALNAYREKIADLRRQLADYQLIYTKDNPKIQSIQSQIASLESAVNQQRSSVLRSVRNQYLSALHNERMLAAEYKDQSDAVAAEDEKMIRYQTLQHEVDTNRATYESLLQKVKESSVSTALQATNVRIVDAAVAPTKPYKPNHLIDLGCGVMAGLLLGLTSVAMRNRSHRCIRRAGVLPRYFPARELGVIPSGHRNMPFRLRHGTERLALESGEVQAWLEPDSPVSESFRSVMTSILFAAADPGSPRLLLITSPGPGDGKTTIATNLGAAFSAAGRRVLLVDADLRRPRLHSVFGLGGSPGLLEWTSSIQNREMLAPRLMDFVRPTGLRGLFLMPAGSFINSESSLLHTLRFKEAFSALREKFEIVLVDVPPLLCASEVRVMARLSDGVVLVVRASSTRLEDVVATERYLKEDGGTLIGTVLNDAPQSSNPYYVDYASLSVRHSAKHAGIARAN